MPPGSAFSGRRRWTGSHRTSLG